MTLQAFSDMVGPVVSAAWLNAVDRLKYTVFADADTKTAARTALMSDAGIWGLTQGGTGVNSLPLFMATFFPSIWALISPRTAAEIVAASVPTNYAFLEGYAMRYQNCVGDGAADDYAAIAEAVAVMAAKGGGRVRLQLLHKFGTPIVISSNCVELVCEAGSARGTATAAGGRLIYSGGATHAIKLDGGATGKHGIRLAGFRLENQGTGTKGIWVFNVQNCNFEGVHCREFSADNWLVECDTNVSCIYNNWTNCSGWKAAGTAIGIRFVEGAGKTCNNNSFRNCGFPNNLVGIQQDTTVSECVFETVELGSCGTGAKLRGRTTIIAGNIENCTVGVELVTGGSASLAGSIHFGGNGTDVVNPDNLSITATMHGGGAGNPISWKPTNTGLGFRGAAPPTTGGINYSDVDGNPVVQLVGSTHITFSSGITRMHQDVRIDGAIDHNGSTVGLFGTAPAAKQTITGSRASGAALAALLTQGALNGYWNDGTSA